jgi:hypothetical protein
MVPGPPHQPSSDQCGGQNQPDPNGLTEIHADNEEERGPKTPGGKGEREPEHQSNRSFSGIRVVCGDHNGQRGTRQNRRRTGNNPRLDTHME